MPNYEAIIGLETHIQINTETKIFCTCKADSWDDPANTNICPVCTGLPGVLPVLNERVVEKAALLAAAMQAEIQGISYFDRKNYFYPDLPKGYQISQYDQPLARGGFLAVPLPDGESRRVNIHKLHIEEDAGKTINENSQRLIDFNRCGVPLIEMVTGPDLRSAEEAAQYLIRLRQLLRWLGVSEADMEKGHLRADANVSIRPEGADFFNPKTEIKNVNSVMSLRDAINAEIKRQIKQVEAGGKIEAWTLDWDDNTGVLRKMRSKETEADYRYFREPDLLPVHIDDESRERIISSLPELPLARRARFCDQYELPEYDADLLTGDRELSEYFEQAVESYSADAKRVSNWVMNDVLRMINERGITPSQLRLKPGNLADIIKLVDSGTINTSTGKSLIESVQDSGKAPGEIVEAEGLGKVSDEEALRAIIVGVIEQNPDQVATYKSGKTTIIGWFVGQVMKQSRGKADPQLTRSMLEDLLSE
jgi:aspartyl-tRNA(Asn)/glutamyl-tRNA(Gln) amidotransferase subunit B